VEPKPQPTDAIVTDDKASAAYNISIEDWGERGWAQVGNICRWAVRSGKTGVDCPTVAAGR
jgi:hypothetical protein